MRRKRREVYDAFRISRVRLVVAFLVCFTVACGQDVVKLTGGSGNNPAIVLMDYIEPGKVCPAGRFNDKIFEVKNTLKFGKASAGCDPQVSVFAFENSMSYEPTATWTDGRDTHIVNLQPLNVVPVSVWLARQEARNDAKDYVGKADQLYNSNRVGVGFSISNADPPSGSDPGGPGQDITLSISGDLWCDALPALKSISAYTPGQLNVYFVTSTQNFGIKGIYCNSDSDGNTIFINQAAFDDTVAHEIGHAFGLNGSPNDGHVSDSDNIMQGGTGLSSFTLGQIFRMNVHKDSRLNKNGHRTGPTEDCPWSNPGDNTCPKRDLDHP